MGSSSQRKAAESTVGDAVKGGDIDAKFGLGVDLVDVLAAGPGGAGEAEAQLFLVGPDAVGELDAGDP